MIPNHESLLVGAIPLLTLIWETLKLTWTNIVDLGDFIIEKSEFIFWSLLYLILWPISVPLTFVGLLVGAFVLLFGSIAWTLTISVFVTVVIIVLVGIFGGAIFLILYFFDNLANLWCYLN